MRQSAGQLADRVAKRAHNRCEYCRMHQALQGATFHVEHIMPKSRGGNSNFDNLAWCCPSCNLHKSDRIEALDPQSGMMVPLFNPRRSSWSEHHRWEGHQLVGQTDVGRATVLALDLNHTRRILIRRAEERFAMFPEENS
jgi:hypothetical protein